MEPQRRRPIPIPLTCPRIKNPLRYLCSAPSNQQLICRPTGIKFNSLRLSAQRPSLVFCLVAKPIPRSSSVGSSSLLSTARAMLSNSQGELADKLTRLRKELKRTMYLYKSACKEYQAMSATGKGELKDKLTKLLKELQQTMSDEDLYNSAGKELQAMSPERLYNFARHSPTVKDMFEKEKRSILEQAGALSLDGAEAYHKYCGLKGENEEATTSGANMNFQRLRLVTELAGVGRQREAVLVMYMQEEPASFEKFSELDPRSLPKEELKDDELLIPIARAEERERDSARAEERERDCARAEEREHYFARTGEREHNFARAGETEHNSARAGERERDSARAEERERNYARAEEREHYFARTGEREHNFARAGERERYYARAEERERDYARAEERERDSARAEERERDYARAEERERNYARAEERERYSARAEERERNSARAEERERYYARVEGRERYYARAEERERYYARAEERERNSAKGEEKWFEGLGSQVINFGKFVAPCILVYQFFNDEGKKFDGRASQIKAANEAKVGTTGSASPFSFNLNNMFNVSISPSPRFGWNNREKRGNDVEVSGSK